MYDQLCAGVESEDAQQGAGSKCDSVQASKPWPMAMAWMPCVEHVDRMQDSQSFAGVQSLTVVQYAQPCTGAVYDQLIAGVECEDAQQGSGVECDSV